MSAIIVKQAAAAQQSAAAVASDALRHCKECEDNMQALLGESRAADEKAAASGNAQDKAAATRIAKKADNAVKAFKAAARALNTADKAAERAKAAHAKAQHAQDTQAAKDKAAATDKVKGKLKAAPLTEKAVHDMVINYVSGNAANAEIARELDIARKDNAQKLKDCAAAIPSQDRLIQWSLEIIKAAYQDDQSRDDGKHKCKDRVAALKRLGAAYIAANKATMGGLEFVIKALGRSGNYEVKFQAAPVKSAAEEAAAAEAAAAKDWQALIEMGAKFGITEAALIAAKAKAEAEAEAAKAAAKANKAAKAAQRKAKLQAAAANTEEAAAA